ncbi:hypothetical protein FRACYDRAFT_241251 [Fragilariopsis cylindrus CCMP1102]|uniref:Uncharacterized protein n=1 Tax=Fragilariopsis cylindrus CCMP1102 TaxID=635003 RepID=A0A1E7F979_9STRA|nr:hypothetical protein FRACYDRAFT_241251 [Fragilariopsis cylindrus CCMP1102]|eukprot:OEU14696.1 hypothetical protein FRACYDRAFT_241251 [Fragilariopsis cylindrus CCMP1102]
MNFSSNSSPIPTNNDLTSLPSEWAEHDTQMIIAAGDEEDLLSATSFQAAAKVLNEWLSDESQRCSSLMEVDEQIGNNLLGDDIFGCGVINGDHVQYGCTSPTGPSEELRSFSTMNMIDCAGDNIDDHCFLVPLLVEENSEEEDSMDFDDEGSTTCTIQQQQQQQHPPIIDQKRYQEILKKLEESMKRSQETRKSLTMKTPKTEEYNRTKSITGVISSIESSSRQLNAYLQTMQRSTIIL